MPSPPPSPARPEPSAKVSANTRLTLMPRPAAASRLSTAARTCAPKRVLLDQQLQRRRSAATTTRDQEQPVGAEVEPEHVRPGRAGTSAARTGCCDAPKK